MDSANKALGYATQLYVGTEIDQGKTDVTTSIKDEYISPLSTRVGTQETLVRQSGNGVEVARKVDGSYTSTRTNMSASGFAVQDSSGNELSHLNASDVMLAQGALKVTGAGTTSTVTQSGVYGSIAFKASNGLFANSPITFPSGTAFPAANYNLALTSSLQTVYMSQLRSGNGGYPSLYNGGLIVQNPNASCTAVVSGFAVFEGLSAGTNCVLAVCDNADTLAYAMATAYGNLLTLTIPPQIVSTSYGRFFLKARTSGGGDIGKGSEANCKASLTVIY